MHKTPPGFRFITAGCDTVLQNLSKNVGNCLNKLIQISKTFAQYRIKGIDNCVFIIDNRDVVVKFLSSENFDHPGKKSISTWDYPIHKNSPQSIKEQCRMVYPESLFIYG
jgi:hypothetical protein